jgi:hypothetical protein
MGQAKRGLIGEAAVLHAFIQRGFDVLMPFGEGLPYDLVVPIRDGFLRVQCKTAWPRGGCLVFNSHATDHGRGPVSYVGRADLCGVYFSPRETVYLVPVDISVHEGRLRLDPTRNNQRRRIRWADDYSIDRWTEDALHSVLTGDQGSLTRLAA